MFWGGPEHAACCNFIAESATLLQSASPWPCQLALFPLEPPVQPIVSMIQQHGSIICSCHPGLKGQFIKAQHRMKCGNCRLELSVLDVAMSVQRKQCCRIRVARDIPLFFCWAPDRPSLLVRQSGQHVRYDVMHDAEPEAHPIMCGSAAGMGLQWAANPEVLIKPPLISLFSLLSSPCLSCQLQ